ncbi:hypothetical protein PIB30_044690 [Stylosanthes scabra]|uniref:Uncharacterized protein n=1 Tax=Stylosanthes scabra TaxID=79078 RepID=A0ABU6RFZ7_9FABA|nr:hypothetical protein [Stylosanthes scabra]
MRPEEVDAMLQHAHNSPIDANSGHGSHHVRNVSTWNREDLGYNSEPERTLLRRRRKARRRARQAGLEQQLNMAAENNDDNFNNVENQNRVTLGQYINPTTDSCGSTIRRPAIQANNFKLKPSLIQLVQQD